MSTALWLIWHVVHLLGLPMAVGYLVGRWTQRRDTAREQEQHRNDHNVEA